MKTANASLLISVLIQALSVLENIYFKLFLLYYRSLAPWFTPCIFGGSGLLIFLVFCVLFIFILCHVFNVVCLFLWIIQSWLSLRFSLTIIKEMFFFRSSSFLCLCFVVFSFSWSFIASFLST